jgi:hypothetical protein
MFNPCARCMKFLFCANRIDEDSKAQHIQREPEGSCFKIPKCKECLLHASGHCKNSHCITEQQRIKAFTEWDAKSSPKPACFSSQHSKR